MPDQRPSSPLDGGDVFRRRSQRSQNSPFFGRSGDDPDDFWHDLDGRHAQHRQHITWLGATIAGLIVAGVLVHGVFLALAVVLLIPLSVELFMLRYTRSRVRIPDYRPKPPVEIELDDG